MKALKMIRRSVCLICKKRMLGEPSGHEQYFVMKTSNREYWMKSDIAKDGVFFCFLSPSSSSSSSLLLPSPRKQKPKKITQAKFIKLALNEMSCISIGNVCVCVFFSRFLFFVHIKDYDTYKSTISIGDNRRKSLRVCISSAFRTFYMCEWITAKKYLPAMKKETKKKKEIKIH